jgi:uncharacterized protein YgiM (DUF1202 family)
MKRIMIIGLSVLLLSSPLVSANSSKKDGVWDYIMTLGPAAGDAVSAAMEGKKPAESAMQALQEAYEQRMERVLKKPAEAAKVASWHNTFTQLLQQKGALEHALVQEEIILAQVTTNRSPLNIRAYPNADTDSLGKADKGALIQILKKTGDWYQIRASDGTEGFVTKQYVTIYNDCLFATVNTPRSPLNIRSAKNSSSRSLGKIEKGAKLCVLNAEDSWMTLRYKGQTAYAAGQFIRLPQSVKTSAAAPKEETPKKSAAVPKEEAPKESVAAPKEEAPKKSAAMPKEEAPKESAAAPKEEAPKESAAVPKEEAPTKPVVAPSLAEDEEYLEGDEVYEDSADDDIIEDDMPEDDSMDDSMDDEDSYQDEDENTE